MNTVQIAYILETAERLGAETDIPEGTRYIQISDTLANQMVDALRRSKQNTAPFTAPSHWFDPDLARALAAAFPKPNHRYNLFNDLARAVLDNHIAGRRDELWAIVRRDISVPYIGPVKCEELQRWLEETEETTNENTD